MTLVLFPWILTASSSVLELTSSISVRDPVRHVDSNLCDRLVLYLQILRRLSGCLISKQKLFGPSFVMTCSDKQYFAENELSTKKARARQSTTWAKKPGEDQLTAVHVNTFTRRPVSSAEGPPFVSIPRLGRIPNQPHSAQSLRPTKPSATVLFQPNTPKGRFPECFFLQRPRRIVHFCRFSHWQPFFVRTGVQAESLRWTSP